MQNDYPLQNPHNLHTEPPWPAMYYSGCWLRPGHYLYSMTGRLLTSRRVPEDFPCRLAALDGGFLSPRLPQVQGRATHVHLNGWTILSFWDQSGDVRPESCSTFVLRGLYPFAETCAIAQKGFPRVWERLGFPIVLREETGDG